MGIKGSTTFGRAAALVLLAAQMSGCKTLQFWKDDAKEGDAPAAESGLLGDETKEAAVGGKETEQDERELKLAKLWARVDELEEEQFRQKERIRVLEKGLTLGLIPEELKTKGAPSAKAVEPKGDAVAEIKVEAPAVIKTEPKVEAPAAGKPTMSKEESEKYQAALASAHDHYRAGRYGRAIVEYSDIGKIYGDLADGGMHLYWVARCWINLKEYNTARQQLVDFLKDHPGSAWAPRGKLELARVEWKLGLGETALQRFRDIIQQHPYEDAAEMAKMELQNLDKTL